MYSVWKELCEDTIFLCLLQEMDHHWSSEPREGDAVCRAKEVPSFLFKTLVIRPAMGIEPGTFHSVVKCSTNRTTCNPANPAVVKQNFPRTFLGFMLSSHWICTKCDTIAFNEFNIFHYKKGSHQTVQYENYDQNCLIWAWSKLLVIFLDFHSTKQGLPLVDSWSRGLD